MDVVSRLAVVCRIGENCIEADPRSLSIYPCNVAFHSNEPILWQAAGQYPVFWRQTPCLNAPKTMKKKKPTKFVRCIKLLAPKKRKGGGAHSLAYSASFRKRPLQELIYVYLLVTVTFMWYSECDQQLIFTPLSGELLGAAPLSHLCKYTTKFTATAIAQHHFSATNSRRHCLWWSL